MSLKKSLLLAIILSSVVLANDNSIHLKPKNDSQTGDIVLMRNSGWDALTVRKYGTSNGNNYTNIDVLSYPENSNATILDSITDSAIIAKRQDTSGNTELVGLFSNGYPDNSQIHGIEIQAFGQDAKVRDFVFLTKDNTPEGDKKYHHYILHHVEDPTNQRIINYISTENRLKFKQANHNFVENDAVCIYEDGYYKTNASSNKTNNHNYIGIVRNVIDNDDFEIALPGSVIPKIIGHSGDKIYLDTRWGKLTTTKPEEPNYILLVGINISNKLMQLTSPQY